MTCFLIARSGKWMSLEGEKYHFLAKCDNKSWHANVTSIYSTSSLSLN